MTTTDLNVIFQIKDADINVRAYFDYAVDPAQARVTISDPDHDALITLSVADFRRLAAAIDRQF